LFSDRNDGLARHIATQDKHVYSIELGAVDKFLEANVRTMEVGGEEHLDLPIGTRVFLAPKHKRTLALELGQIFIYLPLRNCVVVGPPLRLLQIDVRPIELLTHHPTPKIVLLESGYGLH
jgi:hypothetical protein